MSDVMRKKRKGFSLIELVIVVVIIGIIAAIAIPKMSRGATGAAEAALNADLQVLRNALELYQAEHNGKYPDPNLVQLQLTGYTNSDGTLGGGGTGGFQYGPYLKAIPPLPVGTSAERGKNGLASGPGTNVGWIYSNLNNGTTPTVSANTTTQDSLGTLYSAY